MKEIALRGRRALARPRRTVAAVLRATGDWMARNRRWISALQWGVIAFYAVTVSVPAFLPAPPHGATLFDNFTLFAQFVFWGIWWPGVILVTLLAGRLWCGVLCPEGELTETVSRVSANRPTPRWVRWDGWKFVAFATTTLWGQLISVYEYPKPVLLILGGSTVAAIVAALLWGRNKRVWCKHLCPVNGVFGLLSRHAVLHMRVDRKTWDITPVGKAVDCAPLVDIRRMTSSSGCHLCGRCSGHRNAVVFAPRMPGEEIAQGRDGVATAWEVRLLLFGMLGLAAGAFQWSASPWLVTIKQFLAEWLVDHDQFWLLQDNAPWWLLTHYPALNDVFTWLDGALVAGYILAATLLIGGWLWLWLKLGARALPGERVANFRDFACCLIPLAGVSLFLGLSSLSVAQLRGEGYQMLWLPAARGALVALGEAAALWTAWRWLRNRFAGLSWLRFACAGAAFIVASLPIPFSWIEMFYVW